MNINEAKAKMIDGEEYKFVGSLVPPMLAFARISDPPPQHVVIGKDLGLVVFDPDLPTKPPYRPVEPTNFRAGSVLFENQGFLLTEASSAFPNSKPTKKEFAFMLKGNIVIIA